MNRTVIINRIQKVIILLISYIILLIKRLPLTYVSDDAVNVGSDIMKLPFLEIVKKYYFEINGKYLCDSLKFLTYKCPLILWKILDPIVWLLIIILITKLFTKQKVYDYLFVSIFILLFPYNYLDSAGYMEIII